METRIRTTHVGSLPRPNSVAAELTRREDHGFADDAARHEFDATIASAVEDVVRRQAAVGIDLVSDGEMSKITYSTYVKDRLSGFDGDTPRKPALDLAPYDELRQRLTAAAGGAQSFQRQSCVAPITYTGRTDLLADLAHLGAAVAAAGLTPADAFLNAASPGLVTAFQGNEHYPSHEAYVEAVGEAMRVEYEAIVDAGFTLQLDCPDLAMARHTGFQDLDDTQFLRRAAHHVEVLNHATRNIDPMSMRMHLCWGNYEGPHDHDIELDRVLPIVLSARPAHILFEAANPRHAHEWQVWAAASIPDDKVLVPGVITSTSNYVEHPRHVAELIGRYTPIVGRERVIAGTDCGFGTFAGIGKVDPDVAYKKLRSLVAGAELASRGGGG
ncbi:MAG: cobalamin-independent methionine synthase II family protein [Ilumatobacteraceae bacterium]